MDMRFKADFFAGNRERLKKLFAGTAPIVLTANGLLQRSGDSNYPFRQDSSFWYLTGINEPDVVLVIDKAKEYLILPQRHPSQKIMEGQVDNAGLAAVSGINDIFDNKIGWKQLSTRLKKVKHLATLSAAPTYIEHFGMYTNPARVNLIERIRATAKTVELLDLRPQLVKMRMVKQPLELEIMQQAIDITGQSLKNVKRNLLKYEYEYEIEADISRAYRRAGADGHSFSPIVAGGRHATIPHYLANNDKLPKKGLVLIDTGAEVNNYAADISRTYSLSEPSKRQREVYEAVLDVQNFALSKLKPGVTIRQYEEQVEQYMGEKLRELVLIKSIEHEAVRQYYPHLTSHYLGLDVHDIGDYDTPLQANMVVTVEPGIYIQTESLGVRIEDDVLITETGIEVLSQHIPKKLW